ncbi:MAG: YybH family protein [Woeseiaceae bacterium]
MTRRTLTVFAFIATILPIAASVSGDSADRSAVILTTYNRWVETTNARDIDRWSTFLAPGAVFFPSDGPALDSREAITDYYIELFGDPNFALDCAQTFVEVSESNDIAWARGTCNVTFSLPDGSIGRGSSKWAKVWVRMEDGEWKCRLNTWNSDI